MGNTLRTWRWRISAVLLAAMLLFIAVNLDKSRRMLLILFDVGYAMSTGELEPSFTGPDKGRTRLKISLTPVLTDLSQPTDVQAVPGTQHQVVVLQKGGQALWANLETGEQHPLFSVDVVTDSEQGLLGLAFAPDFASSGRFYVDYVRKTDTDHTVIQAFKVTGGLPKGTIQAEHVVIEVAQPYQNHNAGQIGFGPDGFLYISLGDGGFANDPKRNGQNAASLLGSILRVDVSEVPYRVPADNPVLPPNTEPTLIWAYGLRNPWRFSFDPQGRLIVADVGQDTWEEVNIVRRGDNLGWNRMEALHCFPPDKTESCDRTGLIGPVYEYDHDNGNSITGGYVSTDPRLPDLLGKYVFGDFVRGRIWAIDLPDDRSVPVKEPFALGKWPVLLSSFGRDGAGRLYVVDYGQGRVLRIDP